jgi:hypothetical protein
MEIDMQVVCRGCGEELDASFETDGDGAYIEVEPCEICMGGAEENGRDEGYEDGYSDGEEAAEEKAANDKEASRE